MKIDLPFTGERCVPEHMAGRIKTYQHHLSRYNFALMYTRNKKVLDAACGCGFGTNLFYDVATRSVGADNSIPAINYARERYRGEFIISDLNSEFPKGNFDIVVSFETIEHLSNPEFFINNVKNNANEFLFSVPIEDENQFHQNVYKKEDIIELINNFYNNVNWFSQRGLNIFKGINSSSKYLIGHAINQ